jgi:hypothetical protein
MIPPILRLAPFLVLLALPPSAAQARVYCCKDARGQQVCGDVLPASCADRKYRELNKQGATVNTVDAPLTEAQRTQRDAEARRNAEIEHAANEQRRRDATLLNTYASCASNSRRCWNARNRLMPQRPASRASRCRAD